MVFSSGHKTGGRVPLEAVQTQHDLPVTGRLDAVPNMCSDSYFPGETVSRSKDDHMLELAIASGITTIVTHNLKGLAPAKEFGIRAVTPRQLLEEIG
jgi:predicted nucleic acid-binding protein